MISQFISMIQGNTLYLVITALILAIIVVTTIFVIIPFLGKKGINIGSIITKIKSLFSKADDLVTDVESLLPHDAAAILDIIYSICKKAVDGVEQMYIASQLTADERKAKALEIVLAVLNYAGINVTDELRTVINGVIEAEVLALGHKTPTEAEAAAEKQKLENQITSLTAENTTLKQTINNIQSTVQTAAQ